MEMNRGEHLKKICAYDKSRDTERQRRCILIWQSPQRDMSEKDDKHIPQQLSARKK